MITLSLENQVALITGGSRGIGAACVRMFVEAGAKVAFSYQRAQVAAEALVRECGEDKCVAIQADLSSLAAGKQLVDAAVARFGRMDILVANHGVWPPQDTPVESMSDDQWSHTVGTNLNSVFTLIRQAVVQMKRQPSQGTAGHIVLVSSTAGQRGEAFHCDYAATKGALISMAKGLSTELAPDRILVNCVAPGWVATEMSAPALADPVTRDKVFRVLPLNRIAKPEEVAAPILFLCTGHAGFITGEILNVNGGAVLVG